MPTETYRYRHPGIIAGLRRSLAAQHDVLHELHVPGLSAPARMLVHSGADLHISAAIAANGIWEPQETRLIQEFLLPGQVFVDVGANIGYFAVLAAVLLRDAGQVFAFEPESANFSLLRDNLTLNRCANTLAVRAALGDSDGSVDLYLNPDNLGDHTVYASGSEREHCRVELLKGAEYLRQHTGRIDFIKIDTQGYESQVLAGLEPLLRQSMPGVNMLLEFSPFSLREAGSSGQELIDLLMALEFHCYIIQAQTGKLVHCPAPQLAAWVNLTERGDPGESFTNLFCTGTPLEEGHPLMYREAGGLAADPIEQLFAVARPPWDGHALVAAEFNESLYLARGWCVCEPWGVWSEGGLSTLRFVPAGVRRSGGDVSLTIRGQYFGDNCSTRVTINGCELGDHDLRNASIEIPTGLFDGRKLELRFQHQRPCSPSSLGGTNDSRELAFGLTGIAFEQLP